MRILPALLLCVAAQAVAQDASITEFMARNATTLADEDGEFSDWIEVTASRTGPVNLGGWHLTDDPLNLTKWTFPGETLAAGGSIVVFASGKDRAILGSELHTNFNLDGNGEYLALVEPGGTVIATEFAPQYPPQVNDVSYGSNPGMALLVADGAAATALVPPDGSLGTTWTQTSGGAPVGGAVAHWTLDALSGTTSVDITGNGHDGTLTNFSGNPWGPAQHGGGLSFDGSNDYVNVALGSHLPIYDGTGAPYSITMWVKGPPQDDDRVYSEGSNSNNNPLLTLGTGRNSNGTQSKFQVFIRNGSGTTQLNSQTQTTVFDNAWHHVAWVDDNGNGKVYVDGVLDGGNFLYSPGGSWSNMNRVSMGAVLRAGTCCFAQCELDDVRVFDRVLTPVEVQDVMNAVGLNGPAWTAGTTGVGYEQASGYQSLIGLDLASTMPASNASAYIRVPFTVSDPMAFGALHLRMKYDDGFIAYLNGTMVASSNAPANASWNSASTAARPDVLATSFETFDITGSIGLLQQGSNVLAIHGLNWSANDDDFLILPELEGASAGPPIAYFTTPTPGMPNGIGLEDVVLDVEADMPRGFATNTFAVTLSTPSTGATIHYTLDGTEPTTASPAYGAPLTVSTTTVLRARAFQANWVPSRTSTWTWIFAGDVINQGNSPAGFPSTWANHPAADYEMDPEITTNAAYSPVMLDALTSIPAVSIVTDNDHLFGAAGIYVNPQQEGVAWERPASVEWIYPDGTPGAQVDCGLRIQGGASRVPVKSPKHSFRLLFKSQYGPAKFDFPVFPESNVQSFDTLILRAHFGNSWIHWKHSERALATFMQDQWMKDAHRAMGHASPRNNYAHLYINGVYWGLYNPTERPSAPFLASRFGGSKDEYDAIKSNVAIDGDAVAWNAAMSMANSGLGSASSYAAFQNLVDVTNLADYMILNQYGGNWDWDHHNWYAGRRRLPGEPFRFYCWDSEHVLESVTHNNLSQNHNGAPSRLFTQLLANPEFVVHFGDRVHKHLFNDGELTPASMQARWADMRAVVETAVVAESARWGDYRRDVHSYSVGPYELYTKIAHWLPEQTRLTTSYFPNRTGNVISDYQSAGLYPTLDAPVFSQHGGAIAASTPLTMTTTSGAIWYTTDGTDPRLPGGLVSASATAYTGGVFLNTSTTIKARARSGTNWSALNEASFVVEGVTINEFLAKNVTGIVDNFGEHEDWIELANGTSIAIDLSGYYLTDDLLDPTKWQIPPGTLLMPGDTYLIWADEDGIQGNDHANFKLSVNGEVVGLFLPDGVTAQDVKTFGPQVQDVSYGRLFDGDAPWVTFPTPTPDALNDDGSCGSRRYGPTDPTLFTMTLDAAPTPQVGQLSNLQVRFAPSMSSVTIYSAPAPALIPLVGSNAELLIDLSLMPFTTVSTDFWGNADFPVNIPNIPSLAGFTVYFQAAASTPMGLVGSTALEVRVCP